MKDFDDIVTIIFAAVVTFCVVITLIFFTGCTINVQEPEETKYCYADYYCSFWDKNIYRSEYLCEEELKLYEPITCSKGI